MSLWTKLTLWMGVCCLSGCGYVPKARFDALQTQNRSLLEQRQAHLAEIENLKFRTRDAQDQLARTETEMARVDRQAALDRQTAQANSAPAGEVVGGQLADLSRRYPILQLDPKTGAAKLDNDVLFDSGQTDLKPSAQKLLHELADILQGPEASSLKVMVVGHTDGHGIKGREIRQKYPTNWHLSAARAVAVADALRKAGISEDRLGVMGYGQHQPVAASDSQTNSQRNRRVELYVVGAETPLVGWNPPSQTLR